MLTQDEINGWKQRLGLSYHIDYALNGESNRSSTCQLSEVDRKQPVDLRNDAAGQITSSYQKSCQALPAKIFLFRFPEIHDYPPRIPPPLEGRIAIVTDVRRRGAVDVRRLSAHAAPTKASSRTAKSCGPDTPTLVSSLQATNL